MRLPALTKENKVADETLSLPSQGPSTLPPQSFQLEDDLLCAFIIDKVKRDCIYW